MQSMVWDRHYREQTWRSLPTEWDIVVIGGGITGAGILSEAVRIGLRALLVEQRDFAWGTSSRSSKLVHGGLRYLKSGQFAVTRASVLGREQLLAEGQGLVDPLGFLLAHYEGDRPGRMVYQAGLTVYDLMAMQWSHRYVSAQDFQMMAPYISSTGLQGGFQYGDAQTDDARLVLRVIREAAADGGTALNYVRAERLLYSEEETLAGVALRDTLTDETCDVQAKIIVNATGAWADALRAQTGGSARLRPLRGSHLIFPAWRFPVAQAVSFLHPLDGRPVFAFPWEGVTLLGTTDVDCPPPLDRDPCITADEVAYLMAAVEAYFPALALTLDDVIASYAGIRPVIDSGREDPSKESRDHVVWLENGLLTVTGGKLTTFRQTARHALEEMCHRLGDDEEVQRHRLEMLGQDETILKPVGDVLDGVALPRQVQRRLVGRYGADAKQLIAAAEPGELETIADTPILWAELRWAARAEAVAHLDDLLLRRARLGLLLRDGGASELPRIGEICREELGWDEARWAKEERDYLALRNESYALPPRESIPDWRRMLAENEALHYQTEQAKDRQRTTHTGLAVAGLILLAVCLAVIWRRLGAKSQLQQND